MEKKWFKIEFNRESSSHGKGMIFAHDKLLLFLNRHRLKPGEFEIIETENNGITAYHTTIRIIYYSESELA